MSRIVVPDFLESDRRLAVRNRQKGRVGRKLSEAQRKKLRKKAGRPKVPVRGQLGEGPVKRKSKKKMPRFSGKRVLVSLEFLGFTQAQAKRSARLIPGSVITDDMRVSGPKRSQKIVFKQRSV